MDDLQPRLERLAPPVDVDDALAGVKAASRRRQTRQRGLMAAAMALVVIVLFAGVAVTGGDPDEAGVVASEPDGARTAGPRGTGAARSTGTTSTSDPASVTDDSSVTTSTSTVAGPTASTVPAPSTTAGPGSTDTTVGAPPFGVPTGPIAAPSEVEIRTTPERSTVAVGERLRFRVDVINHSAHVARLTSGGCGPVNPEVDAPGFASGRPTSETWSYTPGTLGPFAATRDIAPRRYAHPREWGSAPLACTADLGIEDLAPGATLTRWFLWDAAAGVPWAGPVGDITVTGTVQVATPATSPYGEILRAPVPVRITDDVRAHASPAAFLDAVELHIASGPWLDAHFGSRWNVELGYVNGGFEVWFTWGNTGLRVRGDTATGAVTDVRALDPMRAPGDDPDATIKDPGEQILFP